FVAIKSDSCFGMKFVEGFVTQLITVVLPFHRFPLSVDSIESFPRHHQFLQQILLFPEPSFVAAVSAASVG
ncbi:hypothetical protein PFISCL1PPCAC_5131, partial [Pristionchus fissidentatus]